MKAVSALLLALLALMFVASGAVATESGVVAEVAVADEATEEVAVSDEAEDEAVDEAEDEESEEEEAEDEEEEGEEAEEEEESEDESEAEEAEEEQEMEGLSFEEETAEAEAAPLAPPAGAAAGAGKKLPKVWIDSLGGVKCERFDIPKYAQSIKKYWKKEKNDKDASADAWYTRVTTRARNALAKSGKDTSPLAVKPATKFVLHITGGDTTKGAHFENHGTVTLTRKGYWPHFQIGHAGRSKDMNSPIRCVQYFPLDVTSFALAWGGHDSIQIEISQAQGERFTNDAALTAAVKALFVELRNVFPTIKNAAPWEFKYKAGGGLPLVSKDTWNKASGVVGHMHAPGSTHGDPGLIDASKLL